MDESKTNPEMTLTEGAGRQGRRVMSTCLRDFVSAIVSGELAEGKTLPSEADLMARFGVSRTTLRETMQHMVAQGLIRSRPRAGTMVLPRGQWNMLDPVVLDAALAQPNDFAFYDALMQAREVLEPAAAAAAAASADNEALVEITRAFEAMRKSDGRDDEAWSIADLAFHTALNRASGNWVFAQFGIAIRAALLASFRKTNRASQSFHEAIGMHEKVLEAIRMRQPETARTAMQTLLRHARRDMEAMYSNRGT
ncbi:FadR/GntR family transcriptional regulator [Cereibacter sphaeroides]|uniref:FadR/GntR family transcriptional regulator n=1 Tax=Cereibacter sphaeroides TaxID=1063 RepID=UPI003990A78D